MKCQWFGAISRKVHPFKTEPSVIWTHGAEGSGQFRSLLIQTKVNVTANHLNFPHFDNSAFCNIFAKSNRFDAFLRSPFARMAELVDALDSKSNVLKKTCRFEPGFGHLHGGWGNRRLIILRNIDCSGRPRGYPGKSQERGEP